MKTIIVANQKGGVGKTTIARHLAFFGIAQGLRVLVVDLDVQGNLTTTFRNIADENNIEPASKALVASDLFSGSKALPADCGSGVSLIAADSGILQIERKDLEVVIKAGQRRFEQLGDWYDLCVVDTGPAVSNLLVVALSVGDYAISPCKPDRDAIAGLAGFFSNVIRVRDETKINPKLAQLGVLPNQVNKKRAYHRDVLEEMRVAWGNAVLPVALYERAAIDLAKDRPVWATDRGESRGLAAKEMKAVCAHIFERMGLGIKGKKNG
ncbi:MAG: ParA family protein [Gammaproteobacteria bacterium]